MKNRLHTICLLLFAFITAAPAQTLGIACSQVSAQQYRGALFICGISANSLKGTAQLRVYRVSPALITTDSFAADLGQAKASDFLQLAADTLHHFLNVYVQQKDRSTVKIFRFDKDFKLRAEIDGVDIARLNSGFSLDEERYYYKDLVYTVKAVADSGGKAFFLNKFRLKSDQQNFEYEFFWQFPFDRKHISSARIIMANGSFVLLYVNVRGGNKKGQWLLKIDDRHGKLRKACRINDAMDFNFYGFSALAIDSASKNILIQGQKLTEAGLSQAQQKTGGLQKISVNFYIAELDSGLEMVSRQDYQILVTEPKGFVSKSLSQYLLKTSSFYRSSDSRTFLEYDLYKGGPGSLCMVYSHSGYFRIVPKEDKTVLERSSTGINPMIDKYISGSEENNLNGKLCLDSISGIEKLYQRQPSQAVKLAWKTDEAENPVWLLHKRDLKKKSDEYCVLGPVKKIYQLNKLAEVKIEEGGSAWVLSPKQFILMRQSLPELYTLQLFNW